MEVEADDLPEFFKVYIAQHSLQKLLIPSEFVNYMEGRESGLAELAGPCGQTWGVELVQDEKNLYFTKGWQDFVRDNVVQDGDFLFFKFHGNLAFSVTIYDESMCRKGAAFFDEISEGKEGRPEAAFQPKGDKKADRPCISVRPSFEKCIVASNIEKGARFNFPLPFLQEHSLSYKSYEKMVLRTGRNTSWEANISKTEGKVSLFGGWCDFVRENCIRIGDICKFELLDRLEMMVHVIHPLDGGGQINLNASEPKFKNLKRKVGDSHSGLRHGSPFIQEGQKEAVRTMPSSFNPSFAVVLKKYNVEKSFLTYIPGWFIKENSLCYERNEKVILRTKKDSSWPVTIIRSGNAYCLCGGWSAFVRANNIKEGDKCKFELVNRLEMKVYITPCSK